MGEYYVGGQLFHHGIKGQKWGVRNGPPYPIEDKVLAKGTRLNSVSGTYFDSDSYRKSGRPIYTYRADEAWDNKVYKGPFSKYLAMYRGARFIKEHAFETTQDLRMPTSSERRQAFEDMLNDKKTAQIVKDDLKKYQQRLIQYNVGDEKQRKAFRELDVDNIKTAKDMRTAYDVFNHAMENAHLNKSTRLYMEKMKKNYDAMVDDNNVNVYNEAHDPIIVFRGDKMLRSLPAESKYLTVQEILDNYDAVSKEMEKKGKHVLL